MKIKENWKQTNGKYACPYCQKEMSKKGIGYHIWKMHGEGKTVISPLKGKPSGRKGITKKENPNLAHNEETKKFLSEKVRGNKNPSKRADVKKKISESMKLAHKEGRAWNIGMSRWNNKPSYPETFFMKVIENEFEDKNYKREYPISIYSIDFAWPDKKKAIEIDGEQHKRFKEQIERDKRKNKCLEKDGWEYIRVDWKYFCNNSKECIKQLKDFIHSS